MRRSDREVKDRKGIEEILLKCRTCHVAMVDDGSPYIVPLSYGYKFTETGVLELYFHSALDGKKLDILRKNNKVCFEISDDGEPVSSESPCNRGYYYSSIIGFGEVVFITDPEEKCKSLSMIVMHHAKISIEYNESQAENVCVYKIVSSDFSGKKKTKV